MNVYQRELTSSEPGGYSVSGVEGSYPVTGSMTVRSLVAMPNTTFEFVPSSGPRFFMNVNPTSTLNPDPTGVLLSTNQITLPANNPSVATFPQTPLASPARCSFSGNNEQHVYTTHAVSIPVEGDYSFRFVSTSPVNGGEPDSSSTGTYWFGSNIQTGLGKPIFLLYTSFDPSNPAAGLVGCNSGSLSYQAGNRFREVTSTGYVINKNYPLITASLSQGNYTLVMSTVEESTVSSWNSADFAQTGVVEQWGPTPPAPPAPELAVTGMSNEQTSSVITVGVIALLLGGLGLIVRKRLNRN
jgi:hypothetical protein